MLMGQPEKWEETETKQEYQIVENKFYNWHANHKEHLPNPEAKLLAKSIVDLLDKLSETMTGEL